MDFDIEKIFHNMMENLRFLPPVFVVLVAIAIPLLALYVLYDRNPAYVSTDLKVLFGVGAVVPGVVYLPLEIFNVTWSYQDVAPAEVVFPILTSIAILKVAAVTYLVSAWRDSVRERAAAVS